MNSNIQVQLQQAIEDFQNGNYAGASNVLKQILQADPNNLPALHILGLIKASQANYKEAVNFLGMAARMSPEDPSIQYNLAKALMDYGSIEDSIRHHKKAVELMPNNPQAWLNYGEAESALGHPKLALELYARAVSLQPNYAEAVLNIGATYRVLNSNEEALHHFDKAISINPNLAEAWSNKGGVLKELKRYEEALHHFDKALNINFSYSEAHSNKAITLHELGCYDQAIVHYGNALKNKSDIDWLFGELLHTKMKISDWSELDTSVDWLKIDLLNSKKVCAPFTLLALLDDPALQQKCSEIYYLNKFPARLDLGEISKRPKKDKIRIGYYSADFHNHATGYLIAELFELHDKNKFELYGFSFGPAHHDDMRKRLVKSFDRFIEAEDYSSFEIAKMSRELEIDIAIDLKGFTKDLRTEIFSYRAAPIQVNYLGYPGTMSATYMDYIVADKMLISSDFQKYYSEKLVSLPNSYQVNDRKRFIAERQFTRNELGLPENNFIFCCFNNNFKILPATFASWMRILRAVNGSVLWLLQDNPSAANNLRKEATLAGINPDRLIFAERMSLADHLARHKHADLFLDTLPYNAHTTTSDALWAGLPVLTLMGHSFASRVAASLLNAIGLPELITSTQEEYESLAIDLAMNPQKLEDIKLKLLNNRLSAPLFDTPLFTKNLEAAYIKMYAIYQEGLPPEIIEI